MTTLAELLAQQQALDRQIAQMQGAARSEAIERIRTLMAEHGLTAAEIIGRPGAGGTPEKSKRPAAVKYRDPNGNTWSGRGLKPRWLVAAIEAGKKTEDFAV